MARHQLCIIIIYYVIPSHHFIILSIGPSPEIPHFTHRCSLESSFQLLNAMNIKIIYQFGLSGVNSEVCIFREISRWTASVLQIKRSLYSKICWTTTRGYLMWVIIIIIITNYALK